MLQEPSYVSATETEGGTFLESVMAPEEDNKLGRQFVEEMGFAVTENHPGMCP